VAKKIIANLEHPRDIAPAALQFLIHDGFQRLDGECIWKADKFKYSIYKIHQPVELIRIDLIKKDYEKS